MSKLASIVIILCIIIPLFSFIGIYYYYNETMPVEFSGVVVDKFITTSHGGFFIAIDDDGTGVFIPTTSTSYHLILDTGVERSVTVAEYAKHPVGSTYTYTERVWK